MHTVEEDLKIDPKTLQLEQIQSLARKGMQATVSRLDRTLLPSIPLQIAFPKTQCRGQPQQTQSKEHQPVVDGVVSDDTHSRSSSSSSIDINNDTNMDDSMGAANLLLLLSRAGC